MTDTQESDDDRELTFLQSVAEAVISLIEKGHTDPEAAEITDVYFDQPVPRSIENEIYDRLPKICKIVRDTYDRAHLVSDTYYEAFQETLPQDIETAKRCLPNGRGNPGVGIRIPQVEGDKIHLAYVSRNMKCAAGKWVAQVEVTQKAYLKGDITGQEAWDSLREGIRALEATRDFHNLLKQEGATLGPLFQSGDHNDQKALESA